LFTPQKHIFHYVSIKFLGIVGFYEYNIEVYIQILFNAKNNELLFTHLKCNINKTLHSWGHHILTKKIMNNP